VLAVEFMKLDTDGDGALTVEEVGELLRSMRYHYTPAQLDYGLELKELVHDGRVWLGEFVSFWMECSFDDPLQAFGMAREIESQPQISTNSFKQLLESAKQIEGDQSEWKVPADEEEEEQILDAAQATEAIQVVMRAYAVAEGHQDWTRLLEMGDVRMVLLDLRFMQGYLAHETVRECVRECQARAGGAHGEGLIHREDFINWYVGEYLKLRQVERSKRRTREALMFASLAPGARLSASPASPPPHPPEAETTTPQRVLSSAQSRVESLGTTGPMSTGYMTVDRVTAMKRQEQKEVVQAVLSSRGAGAALVGKRHPFIELPEVMLKEYYDTLTSSVDPQLVAMQGCQQGQITCPEWIQALGRNPDVARSIILTVSPDSDQIDKNKAVDTFEDMAGTSRREVLFEHFLHFFGPKGIQHKQ